jgi:hypothetical protein
VTSLNPGRQHAEEEAMHGAWAFDLLLLAFTGAVTVKAFRQIAVEHDEGD